jgi:ADP-ribose pyrophosphatase YjhB (NUDIX family)
MSERVHLVTGILERPQGLLLVASRYPNHAQPLWNLPGGRQRPGELLAASLTREFHEETGLDVVVGGLRYVSESYDRATATHFLNMAFSVAADGAPGVSGSDAHVVDWAWVPRAQLAARLSVAVVREPLLAHLADPSQRYFGYADAGITIEFSDSP